MGFTQRTSQVLGRKHAKKFWYRQQLGLGVEAVNWRHLQRAGRDVNTRILDGLQPGEAGRLYVGVANNFRADQDLVCYQQRLCVLVPGCPGKRLQYLEALCATLRHSGETVK